MTDPAKAVASRAHQTVQDRLHTAAQHHVRMPDDAGSHSSFAEDAAAAHRRDAIGELHLAHGPHFLLTLVAVHRIRLHVHRRDNIVTAAGIS